MITQRLGTKGIVLSNGEKDIEIDEYRGKLHEAEANLREAKRWRDVAEVEETALFDLLAHIENEIQKAVTALGCTDAEVREALNYV